MCVDSPSTCGNGTVELPEECDSGNATVGDSSCEPTCKWRCVQGDPRRRCPDVECHTPGTAVCNPDHTCTPPTVGPDYAVCGPRRGYGVYTFGADAAAQSYLGFEVPVTVAGA